MFLPQLARDLGTFIALEQQAGEHHVTVETPDAAPTADEPTAPKEKPPAASPSAKTAAANSTGVSPRLGRLRNRSALLCSEKLILPVARAFCGRDPSRRV